MNLDPCPPTASFRTCHGAAPGGDEDARVPPARRGGRRQRRSDHPGQEGKGRCEFDDFSCLTDKGTVPSSS